jgi:hypothetical protein
MGIKVKVKLFLCLTKHHAMNIYLLLDEAPDYEDVMGEWRYSSRILNLGSTWRKVISFTPRLFFSRNKNPTNLIGG